MDFTSEFPGDPDSILFSPSSTFFACVAGNSPSSVLLRTSSKFHLVRSWELNQEDKVSNIQWSDDGQYLLVVSSTTGTIYVLYPSKRPVEPLEGQEDADGQGWSAKLTAGAEGLTNATWLPSTGPPTVLQFALDDVRATATNLNDQSITILPYPKRSRIFPIPGRPSHFAMLERQSSKDYVGIYSYTSREPTRGGGSSGNLDLERSFLTQTNDSIDLSWSPDGKNFAVWEKSLEYKLHIFTPVGNLRATFMIDSNINSDSDPITLASHLKINDQFEPGRSSRKQKDEEDLTVAGGGLGIRTVNWNPKGNLLAIGGYDDKIRILENDEWTEIFTLDLSKRTIQPYTPSVSTTSFGELKAWSEPRNFLAETRSRGIVTYNEATLPISPAFIRATADSTRPNPKMGISQMAWNQNGTLLASVSDSMPTTIFIHAFITSNSEKSKKSYESTLEQPYLLSILTQIYPIKDFAWKPSPSSNSSDSDSNSNRLAICCGTSAVFFWELFEGLSVTSTSTDNSISSENLSSSDFKHQQLAEAVSIPNDGFTANSLKWSPDGTKLMLIGPDSFCCATESELT